MFFNVILYLIGFGLIWIGSGMIIRSTEVFARRLRLSPFAFSFFILGMLTSIPEMAVGLTSVVEGQSEIFVGNLIGGIPVMFFLVIPLLATFGRGVKLTSHLNQTNLLLALVVMIAPTFLIMDRWVGKFEAILLILLYGVLFVAVQRDRGFIEVFQSQIKSSVKARLQPRFSWKEAGTLLLGFGLVMFASWLIVDKTLYFAQLFQVAPFYVSLLMLSLGTNAPELSLVVQSVLSKKTDVAFGDFIGSAAANTLLFGLLTLISPGPVETVDSFLVMFVLLVFGLGLFFVLARTGRKITRFEGLLLLMVYLIFLYIELLSWS